MTINPEKNRRILVIDDNRAIHEDFRKVLVKPTGRDDDFDEATASLFGDAPASPRVPVFQLDSAYQGREGLEMIEKSLQEGHPYSMAFVDVRMPPGWDGVETTARIWQEYPDLQVVICTAYSDYSWENMLNVLGYSDRMVILKKPFDSIEVMQLAISMTEKWRLYQQAKLRLAELERIVQERTLQLQSTSSGLAAANQLLKEATEKTQKMAGEVLVATKAKSEFLANMSHEIRTPMNGVVGMIELLAQTNLTPEQREFAETIKTSADGLLSIIDDILDFSKIEAGKMSLEKTGFDLRETVRSAVASLAAKAKDKGLDLGYSLSPDVPTQLAGDSARLRQVLLNLLGNAVKFTEKGRVFLDVTWDGGTGEEIQVDFAIHDTGIGISEAVQKVLFQTFTQADSTTTRRYRGTGLGLTICRKLVELMGGSMSLISTVGKGSTFRFALPFTRQLAEAAPAKPGASGDGQAAAQPAPPGSVRVLFAEDNKTNQLVAEKQLGRLGYRSVDIVANGFEAVSAWERGNYTVILMDCQMPGMDGYAAVQKIRELERERQLPHTPIIAMTAHAMQGDRELCLAAGMDDYISKPVNERDLKAVLERATLIKPVASRQPR